MPVENKTTASETKPAQIVSDVVEQRKASLRYFNENWYSEWAEIYRNIHARTKPIMKRDREGNETEDTDKTNVCVPDHFVMLRRGTARLTRNPPNLRVRGGSDDDAGQAMRDKTAAKLMFNWDRSEAQRSFKKIVNIGYGLGWSVGKVLYDEVSIIRRLRKLTTQLAPKDFKDLAKQNDPEIAALVSKFGPRLQDPTPFNQDEMGQIVGTLGDQTSINQQASKYKGPLLDYVYSGDIFMEPGFRSMNESAYVIENSMRDEEWLTYWMSQTSIDPRSGETTKVFADKKLCDKVLKMAGNRTYIDTQEMTLRRHMRDAIDVADPITAGKPIKSPKKRFMVDERHTIVDGHLVIDFVGEESVYLGRLWYPWETYGKYQYCEMVMIPDWLGGIGNSTLVVTRFLQKLRNQRLNQTTDFINNKLLPFLKARQGADFTEYNLVRTGFARILPVENMGDFEFQQDPVFPAEAWQDQAGLQQQMQASDPSTQDFAPGTSDVSQAGKFATTARLADKQADNVTADTLDNINMFVRDVVDLSLAMDQQSMNEPVDVPKQYFERIDAVSIKNAGANARVIKVDWPDLQEVYEVLPEAGSTLAADDEFRVRGLQQFAQMGNAHPEIVNLRAVYKALANATPGVNAEDIIKPEPPPAPPEPMIKTTVSISIKWETLPPDVQSFFLQKEGAPTELTHALGIGDMIQHASKTADAAANLEAPVDHNAPQTPQPQGKNPNGRKPKR